MACTPARLDSEPGRPVRGGARQGRTYSDREPSRFGEGRLSISARDGYWFLAAEESLGMKAAIDLDTTAWQRFALIEANRVMSTFDVPAGGGLHSLEKALSLRQYSLINSQRFEC